MTCAFPEMVTLEAFCSSPVDDENSMSEMRCCNMETRKVSRAENVDRSVVVVNEEEARSVRSIVRTCCRNPNRR